MEFEWDTAKSESNVRKHGVSFREASTVFGDFLAVTVSDPDHPADEHRCITVGVSSNGRPLLISHTDRGARVRIISARELTRSEMVAYANTR